VSRAVGPLRGEWGRPAPAAARTSLAERVVDLENVDRRLVGGVHQLVDEQREQFAGARVSLEADQRADERPAFTGDDTDMSF
jgi:hypothetical protein